MKISLVTDPKLQDTEVTIRCREPSSDVLRILASLQAMDRKLTGEKNGALFLLDPTEILYVDTVDKKTFLYGTKDVYETPLRLYEIEDRLGVYGFIRISKSAIVNFSRVQSIRPEFNGRFLLTLPNGELLVVSRQYAADIKKILEVD